MSGLLLGMVLSVCNCWFHNMVTLPPLLVSTDFGTCSYQCFLSSCTPVSLHMLKCSWAHTLSCLFAYCSFASVGHADMWSIVYYYYHYYYYFLRTHIVYYKFVDHDVWFSLQSCVLRVRSSLLWDVTRRWVVVTDVSGQKGFGRISRNVGT